MDFKEMYSVACIELSSDEEVCEDGNYHDTRDLLESFLNKVSEASVRKANLHFTRRLYQSAPSGFRNSKEFYDFLTAIKAWSNEENAVKAVAKVCQSLCSENIPKDFAKFCGNADKPVTPSTVRSESPDRNETSHEEKSKDILSGIKIKEEIKHEAISETSTGDKLVSESEVSNSHNTTTSIQHETRRSQDAGPSENKPSDSEEDIQIVAVVDAPQKPSTETKKEGNKNADSRGHQEINEQKKAKEQKKKRLNKKKLEFARKKKISKLKTLLEAYQKEIKALSSAELSLDEMELASSSYIREGQLKEKCCRIIEKLEKLEGEDSIPINSKKRIHVSGSQFLEINLAVEKFVNERDRFPDVFDVRDIVRTVNMNYDLGLKPAEQHQVTIDLFSEVGNRLQRRRKREFRKYTEYYYEEFEEEDPAYHDVELQRKLKQNKKIAKANTNNVFKTYAQIEYERSQGQNSSDDECMETVLNHAAVITPKTKSRSLEKRVKETSRKRKDCQSKEQEKEPKRRLDWSTLKEYSPVVNGRASGKGKPVSDTDNSKEAPPGDKKKVLSSSPGCSTRVFSTSKTVSSPLSLTKPKSVATKSYTPKETATVSSTTQMTSDSATSKQTMVIKRDERTKKLCEVVDNLRKLASTTSNDIIKSTAIPVFTSSICTSVPAQPVPPSIMTVQPSITSVQPSVTSLQPSIMSVRSLASNPTLHQGVRPHSVSSSTTRFPSPSQVPIAQTPVAPRWAAPGLTKPYPAPPRPSIPNPLPPRSIIPNPLPPRAIMPNPVILRTIAPAASTQVMNPRPLSAPYRTPASAVRMIPRSQVPFTPPRHNLPRSDIARLPMQVNRSPGQMVRPPAPVTMSSITIARPNGNFCRVPISLQPSSATQGSHRPQIINQIDLTTDSPDLLPNQAAIRTSLPITGITSAGPPNLQAPNVNFMDQRSGATHAQTPGKGGISVHSSESQSKSTPVNTKGGVFIPLSSIALPVNTQKAGHVQVAGGAINVVGSVSQRSQHHTAVTSTKTHTSGLPTQPVHRVSNDRGVRELLINPTGIRVPRSEAVPLPVIESVGSLAKMRSNVSQNSAHTTPSPRHNSAAAGFQKISPIPGGADSRTHHSGQIRINGLERKETISTGGKPELRISSVESLRGSTATNRAGKVSVSKSYTPLTAVIDAGSNNKKTSVKEPQIEAVWSKTTQRQVGQRIEAKSSGHTTSTSSTNSTNSVVRKRDSSGHVLKAEQCSPSKRMYAPSRTDETINTRTHVEQNHSRGTMNNSRTSEPCGASTSKQNVICTNTSNCKEQNSNTNTNTVPTNKPNSNGKPCCRCGTTSVPRILKKRNAVIDRIVLTDSDED